MKNLRSILVMLLVCTLVLSDSKRLLAAENEFFPQILVNGTEMKKSEKTFCWSDMNVPMISVKALADMIGAEIWANDNELFFIWNEKGLILKKEEKKVHKVKNEFWKEWEEIQMSVPLIEREGDYYISLNDIGNILDINVQWNENVKQLELSYNFENRKEFMDLEEIERIFIVYNAINEKDSKYDLSSEDFNEFYSQRETWRDVLAIGVSDIWGGLTDLISQNTNAENIIMNCLNMIMASFPQEDIIVLDKKILDEFAKWTANGKAIFNEATGIDDEFLEKFPTFKNLDKVFEVEGHIYDFASFTAEQFVFLLSNYEKNVTDLIVLKNILDKNGELSEVIGSAIDKLIMEFSYKYTHLFKKSASKATQTAITETLNGVTGGFFSIAEFAWEKIFQLTGASENGNALKDFLGYYCLDGNVNRAYKQMHQKLLSGNYSSEEVYEWETLDRLQRAIKRLTYESIRKITNDKDTQHYCREMEKRFENDVVLWKCWLRRPEMKKNDIGNIISNLTGLPYIGGQRFETPLIKQDQGMSMQGIEKDGMLGCLKWDFDNDGSDEILTVTYENSEAFGEGNKCVRVSMYELNVDTWMISDKFELAQNDQAGGFKDLTSMSGSDQTAFEGNLFLRRANGQYQFFYEYNASPKYLASGSEWYFKGYTYDGSVFSVMENTLNMEYAGSGPETDALFYLTPDLTDPYGQSIADIIQRYRSLGFQAERIGGDINGFYSTVSQDPNCYSLVRLIRGDNLDGQSVYERLMTEGRLEGFWLDIEDNTSSILEITDTTIEEASGELSSETVSSGSYEEFLKTNHIGDYYAIVNAGENQKPILVVTSRFSEMDEEFYTPELGYKIVIYGNDGGTVHQIGEPLPQSESAGPWYFYGNKLICNSRRGGAYTVDIVGDSCTRNIYQGDSSSEWEILSLRKNRGSTAGEMSPVQENNTYSGEYILPTSNSEFLTEETLLAKGLTKEQLGLARNEIFARHGRRFDTVSIQQYFDAQSWYVPKYAPAEFDAMGDGIFNKYEKNNMEVIKALEEKLG